MQDISLTCMALPLNEGKIVKSTCPNPKNGENERRGLMVYAVL